MVVSLLRRSTSTPSKLSALLLARYLHVLLTCYPGFQGVQWRVVWRHVTMVAKFLDLSITSWDRRPFALLDDGRKVLATVLFLSAILHEKVINVIFLKFFWVFYHNCRSTFCWDPEILLPWQRDVTTASLCTVKATRDNQRLDPRLRFKMLHGFSYFLALFRNVNYFSLSELVYGVFCWIGIVQFPL